MVRLIDADAIKIPSTSVDAFENCRNCNLLDEFQVREIIDSAPTIDAVPVRHGKWIKADSQQYFRKHYPCFTCSECGYRKDSQKKWNYCPNCGARMDEE